MSFIFVKEVKKRYENETDDSFAIDDVSFSIHRGEFISIVGESGSGKSTLLYLMGALQPVTSGDIKIDGVSICTKKDSILSEYRKEKTAFVFQDFMLEEEKTVFENVMLPLILTNLSRKEMKHRVEECLELIGISYLKEKKAKYLSGGEKSRVSLARALVKKPEIIFADEPTGSLDSKNGERLIELFLKLKKEGYTIVMVTHNESHARKSDRIIRLVDGEIVEIIRGDKQ